MIVVTNRIEYIANTRQDAKFTAILIASIPYQNSFCLVTVCWSVQVKRAGVAFSVAQAIGITFIIGEGKSCAKDDGERETSEEHFDSRRFNN